MITKAQAVELGNRQGTEIHYGECVRTVGPRGGETLKIERWRSNGGCKLWKTRPEEFSLPIKWGYKGPYSYLTQDNAGDFHLGQDCHPTVKETK